MSVVEGGIALIPYVLLAVFVHLCADSILAAYSNSTHALGLALDMQVGLWILFMIEYSRMNLQAAQRFACSVS